MALLTWKRGSAESAASHGETVGATVTTQAPKKRLRENERLRSVLKESTFSAAVQTLEKNVAFQLLSAPDGSPRWLALLLHAESIGGLSEKAGKHDEAKGSLVQQIISDQIQAIATEEMLDREFFALVPSEATLKRMGEYSLLVNAPYSWVVFTLVDGELRFDPEIGPATYQQALAIQNGSSLREVVVSGEDGANSWARIAAGGQQAEEAIGETITEPVVDDIAGEEDELFGSEAQAEVAQQVGDAPEPVADTTPTVPAFDPEVDDAGDFYAQMDDVSDNTFDNTDAGDWDELSDLPEGEDFAESDADKADGAGDSDSFTDEPEPIFEEGVEKTSYTVYLEENAGREYTEDDVRETVARRFLVDGLDLRVDMAEFELAFQRGPAPRVNVLDIVPSDNTDWLGNQVAQLALAANSELEALRTRHDEELRQLFVDLTSRHIHEVNRQVSLTDSDNEFGRMMEVVEQDRQQSIRDSHTTVTRRRQDIDRRFNEEADAAAEAAAAQARATYTQMNRGRRDAAIAQVEREVSQDIEAKYENQRQQILRLREASAELSMQQGKTLIHEALAATRREQSEAEERLLEVWNNRLLGFIDENRKADLARAAALAENLARTNAVEEERKLARDRMDAMRADHQARVAELEARMEQVRQDAVAKIQQIETDWQRKLSDERDETRKANEHADELRRQMGELGDTIRGEYETRLRMMAESRDALKDELDTSERATLRVQRTLILLMIVLVVAGLAIGGIAGWMIGHSSSASAVSALVDSAAVISGYAATA